MSNNENLSEEDIKLRYVTPALEKAGWTKEHIRMEYFFTEGQILVKGKMRDSKLFRVSETQRHCRLV